MSKLVMFTFSTKYKAKLENLQLLKKVVLLKIYVDDQNQSGWTLPYGAKYYKGKLFIPGLGWRG